ERQQALAAAEQARQVALARAAEAARQAAAVQTAAVAEAERLRQREAACAQMLARARAARTSGNITVAVQLFDGALALQRRDDVARELAEAKAQLEAQARTRAAEEA